MVLAVRDAFPDLVIHVDCNSAYSLEHLPLFQELDNYRLAMIEQPFAHDDLVDHARLQKSIRTPLCLDESIVSLPQARKAIEPKACGWINIKLGRVSAASLTLSVCDAC